MRRRCDCWFRRYIDCLLVYIVCFPTYPFSSLVPYLSPPLLVFSFENRPAPFPGRMSSKATKPGFRFFVLFRVVVHFFWLVNARFCCVRFSLFSIPSQDIWKRVRNDLFCVEWDVKPQLNQSIHQSIYRGVLYFVHALTDAVTFFRPFYDRHDSWSTVRLKLINCDFFQRLSASSIPCTIDLSTSRLGHDAINTVQQGR